MAKQKLLKNAPLEAGDRVVCLKMQDDYGVPGGIPGIVKGVSNVFGENQYNVYKYQKSGITLSGLSSPENNKNLFQSNCVCINTKHVPDLRDVLE